ncbi:DUF6787 family protein [Mangrovibacterium marinum]|uniref:DUF6787 domain-containing protein n=1 Tax=Mangrovibacterium marinum TaxID=1639118 RepID=A0A2T5BY86_9BACT|nr:DUF6787 family protein [Mangrovibacterium marinum]PTN06774.1 hypothetical protein C8N47_12127 [Mangrovibacterium marinum]
MLNKLKERWQIDSNFQLAIIFFVFSISGSSTLVVRKFIFEFIHVNPDWPFLVKALIYLLTIVPLYQASLLVIGSLLGQFHFFWRFEKKMLRRFGLKLK